MLWYEGNIAEAVNKSKVEGAVFGVAILGEDEGSKELEAALNTGEVQDVLKSGKFVWIRISGNSEPHRQFAQIYTNAPSPSIYLIGDKGATLEVINAARTSTELKGAFQSAWSRHFATLNPGAASVRGGTPAPVAAPQGDGDALVKANEDVRVAEAAANQADLTLEEKIERAQKLAAAKRAQKLAEEAEDAKRKERERREAGKGMAELKRWQTEQEAKQLVDERKREKKEEQELRKKLKEQIAQDRAARNARSNVSYLQDGPQPQEEQSGSSSSQGPRPAGIGATSSPKDYTGLARLQFRLPAGASISHAFEPTVALSDVRAYLIENNCVPFRNFTLSIAYPRRQFTTEEYSSTLRDLGLVPSAALLILPEGGSRPAPMLGGGGVGTWLSMLFQYLLIPFTFIYSLFQRALLPPPQASPPVSDPNSASTSSSARSSARGPTPASAAAELRNRRGNQKAAEEKKPSDGNIHRLRTREGDSGDENGTWNGNSTQQM